MEKSRATYVTETIYDLSGEVLVSSEDFILEIHPDDYRNLLKRSEVAHLNEWNKELGHWWYDHLSSRFYIRDNSAVIYKNVVLPDNGKWVRAGHNEQARISGGGIETRKIRTSQNF